MWYFLLQMFGSFRDIFERQLREDERMEIEEQRWLNNSFAFRKGRYSIDEFNLIDGKIVTRRKDV